MKTRLIRSVVLACLALAASASAPAKDLGVRGASWPVAEADLLESIAARLEELNESGELARLEEDARSRARRSLEEPKAVAGIAPAVEARTRRLDPSIRVERDIVGPGGEVIARAGARINPFDLAPLSVELLFVDGRREAEVAWALALGPDAKIVLLAGRPLDLMRRHGRPFFFDMGGRLAARLKIRVTPTRAVREGGLLRLDETPVADFPNKPEEPEETERGKPSN